MVEQNDKIQFKMNNKDKKIDDVIQTLPPMDFRSERIYEIMREKECTMNEALVYFDLSTHNNDLSKQAMTDAMTGCNGTMPRVTSDRSSEKQNDPLIE